MHFLSLGGYDDDGLTSASIIMLTRGTLASFAFVMFDC